MLYVLASLSLCVVYFDLELPVLCFASSGMHVLGSEMRCRSGNVEEAFKMPSIKIVEGETRIGGQEHFYLETNATLVIPGKILEHDLQSHIFL